MGQTLSANTFLLNEGYEKLNSQDDGSYLKIHPQELQFPFELKKQIPCSLRLSNNSNKYLAFKVKTTNPKEYYVTPNIGVVSPRSTCDIIVTMQAQKEAPPDMQCKDKFLIQSIVANHKIYHSKNGATTKDIMFKKESGYEVQECKLKVAYVAPPQPPSSVREGSDQDTSLQILTTNPKNYAVRPNIGVVLPRSTYEIIVTMQAQKEAPLDMQCKDKFMIQSIIANHKCYHSKNGATTKDVTSKMFKKDSGYKVQEFKMKVAYIAPPQPPSSIRERSDEDLSPNRVRLLYINNSSTDASTSSSKFWQDKYTNLEAAFKTYIMMKEGRIPDQVANILGSSNSDAASKSDSPLNARGSCGDNNI